METQIQIKINHDEKKIIERASELQAVGYSTFCRIQAVKEARRILQEFERSSSS